MAMIAVPAVLLGIASIFAVKWAFNSKATIAGPDSSSEEAALRRRQTIQIGKASKEQGVADLRKNYVIDSKTKVLGTGSTGRVFLTQSIEDESFQVAIKVINKDKLDRDNMLKIIQEEVAILQTLDHPNIVKYYETYNDQKYVYLVMEYVNGQALFDKITQQENQTFSEASAASYMQ